MSFGRNATSERAVTMINTPWLLRSAGFALAGTLAGCGGGGVGSIPAPPGANVPASTAPAPTPTPMPTPAPAATAVPAPTPTPNPTNYDSGEYRATIGGVSMNALRAYQQAATGSGVVIGVIDTGIDLSSAEFAGRIAASGDVAGSRTAQDADGHGTAVAFTAAGGRNGAATHGVAFDARLAVYRADAVGSCGSSGDCLFGTDAVAAGLDAARQAGARVINLSLGGSSMPQAVIEALTRATAAGIVVVIAAGNDGAADPDGFAMAAVSAAVRNQIIIAGSVDATDTIDAESNRAGAAAMHYLGAVGEQVRAPDHTGTEYLWSGTSFAAPQISGAAALLAQAFPRLTGAQIAEILLTTARDVGAPGMDAVYGRGVIDLTRAFQPLGATTLAGTRTGIATTGTSILSKAMGDASPASAGAIIIDGYDRAFTTDLAARVARSSTVPALAGFSAAPVRNVAAHAGGLSIAMAVQGEGIGAAATDRVWLTNSQVRAAKAIAGTVVQRFGQTSLAMGFSDGATMLAAHLAGWQEPAFLIAGAQASGLGIASENGGGIRQQFGPTGATVTVHQGDLQRPRSDVLGRSQTWGPAAYARVEVALDRRFGPLAARLAASRLDEGNTLLGARLDAGLGAPEGSSWFLDANARLEAGNGWTVGGMWRHGRTLARIDNGVDGSGSLTTAAFSLDIGKDRLHADDSIGLRVSQPLRVTKGGVDLILPTGWDYARNAVTTQELHHLGLAPTGREIDVEARYAVPLGFGRLATHLFWREEPGNVERAAADYGLAVRYTAGL